MLVSSVAVCLFTSPFNSIDPVNLPKLCLLVILSFIAAGFALSRFEFLKARKSRALVLATGLFLTQLTIVLLVDSRDFSSKFYGIYGRNTGYVAYLSLTLLLIGSAVSASKQLLMRYVLAIVGTGTVLAFYGLAQSQGYDFYKFDNAYGTNVFGSFGNPNFQSAFMGITAAAALTLIIFSKIQYHFKAILLVVTSLALFNVSVSSQQGYLNFASGMAAAITIYLFKSRKPIFGWSSLVLSSIFGLIILLGILNIGPLGSVIYKSSLLVRGFYWRAAGKMMLEHPLFGVGMDGFGDAYLRFRSSEIATYNTSIYANTAHSIPLDIGSNGGLVLFLAYISIIFLVVISVVRVLKRNTSFDVVFTTIVAAWMAFQVQSLISINQLGLGVWGWSLSGLIIGYELNTRRDFLESDEKLGRRAKTLTHKISALALVMTFVTTGIGISIALPPYLAANKFYSALQSGDADIIQPAAYLKPLDQKRFLYVAQLLQGNNLDARAIAVLRDATGIYPDSIELWRLWAINKSANPTDLSYVKAQMKRLDPFNPDLK